MNEKYQQRIQNAVMFIEQHLTQPIGLEEVAKASHFSPFHFHRVFKGMMNETLNNFIVRRRIEMAANMLLVQRKKPITEIALHCGFSSSANFSKAFKLHFGFSPSQIRSPQSAQSAVIGNTLKKYGKTFNPHDMYPKVSASAGEQSISGVDICVEQMPENTICTLASNGGYAPAALFDTWDRLMNWGEQHGIPSAQQFRFAFCYDNPAITPVDKCRYEAAIVIDQHIEVPSPFVKSTFPCGTYARFYIKGTMEQVNDLQLALYSQWLPMSGYEPDNLPLLERYLNDARIDGFLELELMLKVKKLVG
ncbi:AraC family transcriptional regulator [Thalassotalea atypica]|uniref:AraC family transcriptional regulator n=1 Tax=Thalassotalea atypica TaxID=2054316 RepID=UPI002572B933|nr:GyrI-like domain-containing protein [Thalassotalea atypica]